MLRVTLTLRTLTLRTITLRRLGVVLRRRMVPLAAYFENIDKRMDKMPTKEQMRNWKFDKVPDSAKKKYARLVNAFGWNAGPMSRWVTQCVVEDPAPLPATMQPAAEAGVEDTGEAGEAQGEEGAAAAAAADDAEGDPYPTEAAEVMVDDTMERDLFITQHPRAKTVKFCACRRMGGGWTKAFDEVSELLEYVTAVYGDHWRAELKLKNH